MRRLRGAPGIARKLAEGLLQADFDVAYAYKPLYHPGLAHAFLNTLLYLDYERTGFDWPVIVMPALGLRLQWSSFVETHCFNSNKVFAAWR